ncbi:SAG1252 family conjugative relaxosome accessory protein [Streptococcus merionis]|uniref:SAG1252 family conjugative relaxosome accessory protein n=1 Tax=Streptococcus merionis TaxID=400065 RepID=UPI0035159179
MKQDIKLVRKQFRMTRQEESMIKEMMKEQQIDSFSDFLRQNLFKSDRDDKTIEMWFSLWQSQKIEQISRDILKVTTLAEQSKQVTAEHLRIILTCVQELMGEIDKTIPLSSDFHEKYMGG